MSKKVKQIRRWVEAAGIRAVKTMAQTAIAGIGSSMLLNDVEWFRLMATVLLAGLLSIWTSLAGLPELQVK